MKTNLTKNFIISASLLPQQQKHIQSSILPTTKKNPTFYNQDFSFFNIQPKHSSMALINPSSSHHTLHRCLTNPQPINRFGLLKLPFNSHDRRLQSVRCQSPKFEPKRSVINSHVEETASSCSSSIDFLTLCHSLKVYMIAVIAFEVLSVGFCFHLFERLVCELFWGF